MNNLLNIIQKYFLILLEPSIALIIGVLTILVSKNSNSHNVAHERLTYAYHPIFLAIEPYLFKNIDNEFAEIFVEKYNKIESEYSLYIYPSLRDRVNSLSIHLDCCYDLSILNEDWKIICYYVNKDYDYLCKKSHMPLRSTAYRLNNNQFSSKPALYWGMFKLFGLPFLVFMVYAFLILIYVSTILP